MGETIPIFANLLSLMSKSKHLSRRPVHSMEADAALSKAHMPALLGAAVLGMLILVIYFPALRGGFILDDDKLLTEIRSYSLAMD